MRRNGYSLVLVMFALLGGLLLYAWAYFSFGWWGVLGLAAVNLVLARFAREARAHAERERRRSYDAALARMTAASHRSRPPRSRRPGGGGRRA